MSREIWKIGWTNSLGTGPALNHSECLSLLNCVFKQRIPILALQFCLLLSHAMQTVLDLYPKETFFLACIRKEESAIRVNLSTSKVIMPMWETRQNSGNAPSPSFLLWVTERGGKVKMAAVEMCSYGPFVAHTPNFLFIFHRKLLVGHPNPFAPRWGL